MKKTITLILSFLIFSILLSYSLVYGRWAILGNIKSPDLISENIFLDTNLNYTIVSYDTTEDLSDFKLSSNCNIVSSFLGRKANRNYFRLVFLDNKCRYQNIYLEKGEETFFDTRFNLKIFSSGDTFGIFSDIDTGTLIKIKSKLNEKISNYGKHISDFSNDVNIFESLKVERSYKEALYKQEILINILSSRKNKYISPISGLSISNKNSKLPNAGRPYRSSYTDGVHHGWDVDAPNESKIRSIDSGVIVRIIKDFNYDNLSKIKYGDKLTYEDKLNNLDILRGNQVWLKTSKGDVVFYSHLTSINPDLEIGKIISVNSFIGTTGITGVPDKNYSDYHLHFSIQKNPYNLLNAGKYSLMDYMKWDWYFKGKDKNYVLKHQGDIFELN